jgi:hypothetical protein
MAAKPTVNWIKPRSGRNIDGSTLPSDTAVRLQSRHHLTPPSQYVVYRLLPKPFWKFWGAQRDEETRLDAPEDSNANHPSTLGGRYKSDPVWNLPSPDEESGSVSFRAWTDTEDARSGRLRSARIWLKDKSAGGEVEGTLSGDTSGPIYKVGGKIRGRRHFEKQWEVRVTKDPWIEVSVLQAESVIDHLRLLEDAYERTADHHGSMRQLPSDTMTYFVDRPLGDTSFTYRLEPEESLTVAVQIPDRQDLRAAFCLRVRDLESGYIVTSPPIFVTHMRDHVIATDITMDMLRNEPRDLLLMLDEARLDVQYVAEHLGQDVRRTWRQLIAAAQELGADSVGEAAFFVGLNTPVIA